MPVWPRRRPDDLLRVVQRLEARVSGMERRILSLTERSETMTDNLDTLRAGEQNLQQEISAAATRVQASLDALAAKINQGVNHDELAADVAAIRADVQAVAAIGGPAQPPAPAPTPQPAPAQQTTTTATAVPGQSTFDGQPVPAQTPQPTDAQGTPVPTPAVDTSGQQPAEQPAPPPAAPDQGQGPVGQAGT